MKAIPLLLSCLLLILGCKLGEATQSANGSGGNSLPPATNTSAESTQNTFPQASPTPARQPANAVCPDPAKPCHHKDKKFDDWELSFKLPAKLVPNKTYASAPFYALILKDLGDVEDCDGGDHVIAEQEERKQLQRTQPGRKVFIDRDCPSLSAVGYDFPGKGDSEQVFVGHYLAIYAGQTQAEAEALLAELKAKYPKAVVKRMTANYEDIQQ